jgi:hypothetical protein
MLILPWFSANFLDTTLFEAAALLGVNSCSFLEGDAYQDCLVAASENHAFTGDEYRNFLSGGKLDVVLEEDEASLKDHTKRGKKKSSSKKASKVSAASGNAQTQKSIAKKKRTSRKAKRSEKPPTTDENRLKRKRDHTEATEPVEMMEMEIEDSNKPNAIDLTNASNNTDSSNDSDSNGSIDYGDAVSTDSDESSDSDTSTDSDETGDDNLVDGDGNDAPEDSSLDPDHS